MAVLEGHCVGERGDAFAGVHTHSDVIGGGTHAVGSGDGNGVATIGGEGVVQHVGGIASNGSAVNGPAETGGIGSNGGESYLNTVLSFRGTLQGQHRSRKAADLDAVEDNNIAAYAVEVAESNLEVASDGAGDDGHTLNEVGDAGKGFLIEKSGVGAADDVNAIVVTLIARQIRSHLPSDFIIVVGASGRRHSDFGANQPVVDGDIHHKYSHIVLGGNGNNLSDGVAFEHINTGEPARTLGK